MDFKIADNNKKILKLGLLGLLIIVAAIFVCAYLIPKYANSAGNGAIHEIASADDLVKISNRALKGDDFGGQRYRFVSDIDMTGVDFTPIARFAGTLDGCGYAINNLEMTVDGDAGLVAALDGSICNLTIGYGHISGGGMCGSFAAKVGEDGAILNCANYANVEPLDDSKYAGGIAGLCYGKIINTVTMIERNDSGEQDLTGRDASANIENCYTYNGGQFEIICNGTDENKDLIKKRALRNLNNRLEELALSEDLADFNEWELYDEFPFLHMSQKRFVPVVGVYCKGNDKLNYDFDRHCFVYEGAINNETIVFETKDNRNINVSCADYSIMTYRYEDIADIVIADEAAFREPEEIKGKDAIKVDLSDVLNDCPDGVVAVNHGYYSGAGDLDTSEIEVTLYREGDFILKGSLKGQIMADLSSNKKKNLKLHLDGADIISETGPAVYAKRAESKIDKENAGLTIKVSGDSSVIGTNYMDIYSAGLKAEGAISAKTDVSFVGDGKLYIEGDLEGVESSNNITVNGPQLALFVKDDAIACKGSFVLQDGLMYIEASDNAVDCNDIYLENGMLGGSVIGARESFIKSNLRLDGATLAYCGNDFEIHPDSEYKLVSLGKKSEKVIEKDSYIVYADKAGNPLMAIKSASDVTNVAFCIPDFDKSECDIYLCSDVKGRWDYNICTDIDEYEIIEKIK